jgi:hypothetical protein
MPGRRFKSGSRAEVYDLRLRMELLDAPIDLIAAEIGKRFGYRPRQCYRLAHGWEQKEAAQRYNALVQDRGVQHQCHLVRRSGVVGGS